MIFIGSKKKFFEKYALKEELETAQKEKSILKANADTLKNEIDRLEKKLAYIKNDKGHYFRVGVGDKVYDVQYRTKAGRFCSKKEKASKSKTTYTEKEVTLENFISVQQALENQEMFATEKEALEYIDTLAE